MWWILVIAIVVLVLVWQIPAVGPFLVLILLSAVAWFIWFSMRPRKDVRRTITPKEAERLRVRTEAAKAESRTHRAEIRVDLSKVTPESLERAQHERNLYDQIHVNRIDAGRIAGEVEGMHYTEWYPVVEQLNREGKLDEALTLCLELIDATERENRVQGHGLPRAYTRRAAIIYRKMKDYDGEVAILKRYIASGGRSPEIEERLEKALALRDKYA